MPITYLPDPEVSTDPFTMVEQALWFALDINPGLAQMVKVGNKIRFCGDEPNPIKKDSVEAADLPELGLMPAGGRMNERNSSSGAGMTARYAVAVQTGDMRTAGGPGKRKGLNQMKWEIIRALSIWRDGIPDLPFVVRVVASDVSDTMEVSSGDGSNARAPDGWTCAVAVEVWLNWPWQELQG